MMGLKFSTEVQEMEKRKRQTLPPPTCQDKSHECISQKRVVDVVPELLKVRENEFSNGGTGL